MIDDFKNEKGNWVGCKRLGKVVLQTKSYIRWNNMKSRCKVGGVEQQKRPTYIGCTMSPLFSDFQKFTDWHTRQIGYDLPNYHIDKDILINGNKEYNEDYCVLVPQALNTFLTSRVLARGSFPQGVWFHKRVKKFEVMVNSGSDRIHVGYFTTPEAASVAYKIAKEAEAYRWYERLLNKEFIVDPRVIERMRTWTLQ